MGNKGIIINLRKQLKKANERIAFLQQQTAQQVLDGAATHPTICEAVILQHLKILLRDLGEEVKPHDTIHHKITNIVAVKNSLLQQQKEFMKMPASEHLKQAIALIMEWRNNTPEQHIKATEFLNRPIVKALLKEIENK